MTSSRRNLLALAGAALAAPTVIRPATVLAGDPGISRVETAVARFAALPVTSSCLVVADHPTASWRVAHAPDLRLFVGSAVKTFFLAQFLRAVEAGRLSEDQQVPINDAMRSPSSPVFLNLTGTTQARSVLEAMIAHSDNTATDAVLAAVGPEPVRALIREAGLGATQIPESTRRLFSYLAGAPEGVDLGWEGAQRMAQGTLAERARAPLNDAQTMASTAEDLVHWYTYALRGDFFTDPAMLVEFKRIQAMADALAHVVPPNAVAYGKGGSIDWAEFHCLSLAGQMVVAGVPITFCLTVNWTGPDDRVAGVFQAYKDAVAKVLEAAAEAVRERG